jgi:hypothetical protein
MRKHEDSFSRKMQNVRLESEPSTLPKPESVIGELMRMLAGRHEVYAEPLSSRWLLDNRYCSEVGNDFELTEKGERFSESIVSKSGIRGIIHDD